MCNSSQRDDQALRSVQDGVGVPEDYAGGKTDMDAEHFDLQELVQFNRSLD